MFPSYQLLAVSAAGPVSAALGTSSATGTLSATIANTPIVPGTLTVTDGTNTSTDNGNGAFTGTITGTVNYSTGAVTLAGAAASTAVTGTYQHWDPEQSVTGEAEGTVAAGGVLSGNLKNGNIVPGTVVLSSTAITFVDDSEGNLISGTNNYGTIDYNSGAFTLTGGTAGQTVSGAYTFYTTAGEPQEINNSVSPTFMALRAGESNIAYVMNTSYDPANGWTLFKQGLLAAGSNMDLGLVGQKYIQIYTTGGGIDARLTGIMANAQ